LRYAQIVQEKQEEILVNVVTGNAFGADEQALLLKKLRQRLNGSIGIRFEKVGEEGIQKTKSGKFKLVVSKIA
jgi:hypothetical protein